MTRLHEADDEKEAVRSWGRTLHAMSVLGFSDSEVSAICAVMAAIYHLGAAGAVTGDIDSHCHYQLRIVHYYHMVRCTQCTECCGSYVHLSGCLFDTVTLFSYIVFCGCCIYH